MASKSSSDLFPGFDNIFDMGDPGSESVYIGKMELPDDSDSRVPVEFGLLRGEWKPTKPIVVKRHMGRALPSDAIWTSHAVPLILGEKAWHVLERGGFSGWSSYAVRVFDKDGAQIEGYKGLVVTGRCGPIDNSRSVLVDKQMPGGVFPVYKGVYFAEDSWDGTDIFCPSNVCGLIFVSRPVRDAFTRAKIRNLNFKPLSQFEQIQL
jgi:hypothetical protein